MVAKNLYFRKTRSPFLSRIVVFACVALFLGILGLLLFGNVALYQKRAELSKEVEQKKAEINAIKQQNAELQATVQTDNGTEYQEKVLREQGLYKKSGEQVITILPPASGQQEQAPAQKKSWFAPLQNLYNSIISN